MNLPPVDRLDGGLQIGPARHDHAQNGGPLPRYFTQEFYTVHFWHIDVSQHQFNIFLSQGSQCFSTAVRQQTVKIPKLQGIPQDFQNLGIVIHQQDLYHCDYSIFLVAFKKLQSDSELYNKHLSSLVFLENREYSTNQARGVIPIVCTFTMD